MNMTLLNNFLLLIASVFIFFMMREISYIIKVRRELIEQYIKELEKYKKSLQDHINFLESCRNDIEELKNIVNNLKQSCNDRWKNDKNNRTRM